MELKTPLYDCHVALGGKIVPFAGYLLPVQYESGVITEHKAVRTAAGLFDVSHMGEVTFSGPDALQNLQHLLTNDFTNMAAGDVRYSPMCNDRGGVVDDLIVYCLQPKTSYLVVIIFAQWFLGYYYDLFPVWGFEGWRSLGLPILVGILCGIGGNVRFYRTVFVNELRREYLRTAAAKGASPLTIYGRHLLRNAAIQIITRASAALPFLFTGSMLLESFFGIPGLGFAGVDALYNSDLQLLKALVVTSALLFVVMNLLADLAYAWADPRIRLE